MSEHHITYRDMSDGDPVILKDLCNALMKHQADMSHIYTDILSDMCYETRLEPSFRASSDKLLLVAFDGTEPVGYVFGTATLVTDEVMKQRPAWISRMKPEDQMGYGFYPEWLPVPVKVCDLNNLYVRPEYRGDHVGGILLKALICWFHTHKDAKYGFVHVSNGNNAVSFYEHHGFHFTHDVLGGIIKTFAIELS